MDFLKDFDFLPNTLNPGLKKGVYLLILFHVLILTVYIILVTKSFFKKKTIKLDWADIKKLITKYFFA